MNAQNKEEIRGITLPMIRTFIICTIAICGSVIGAGVYVKSTFNDHERRVTSLEAKVTPMQVDVISLIEWRKEVTAYYLPKPKQP